MKVLLISTYLPEKNGIATYAYNIVQQMKKETKIDFTIIANKLRGLKKIQKAADEKIFRIFDKNDFFYFKKLIHIIKKEKPDIVHIQHSFALFGKHFGSPLIPFLFYTKFKRIPVITTLHTVWIFNEMKKMSDNFLKILFAKLAFYIMTKIIEKFSTKIIVLNEATKTRLIKDYHCWSDKIEIVHYGIEKKSTMPKNAAKKRLGFFKKFVLLCPGLPYKTKGFEYAILAMRKILKKVPNALLIIANAKVKDVTIRKFVSGDYVERLQKIAKDAGVQDKVIFAGEIQKENPKLYLSATDVVLLPYIVISGASSSLYFAWEYGRPCIATNLDVFKEIENGKNGFLVKPADPDELAKAVIKIADVKM